MEGLTINRPLILIYLAVCVCVCVCVRARTRKDQLNLFRVLSSDGRSPRNEILSHVGMRTSDTGVKLEEIYYKTNFF
jgi:hypothetical protein